MSTIVVTGAGGLLGRHLLPLFPEEAKVVAVGRLAPSTSLANVTPVSLDLSAALDRSRLPPQVDQVFYLAQSSHFREFPARADDVFQVNTAQVMAMLDYSRQAGARSFVFASSGGVYAPSDAPLTEQSPLGTGLGFYAATKRATEILAEAYAGLFSIVVLRFFFIYGPGQQRDMLIPRLADSVRQGRPVALQGERGLSINPVHASDAARATLAAGNLGRSGTFNVAGPQVLSLRDICDLFGEKLGRAPVFEVDTSRQAPSMIADIQSMSSTLVAPRLRLADAAGDVLRRE